MIIFSNLISIWYETSDPFQGNPPDAMIIVYLIKYKRGQIRENTKCTATIIKDIS